MRPIRLAKLVLSLTVLFMTVPLLYSQNPLEQPTQKSIQRRGSMFQRVGIVLAVLIASVVRTAAQKPAVTEHKRLCLKFGGKF